MQDTRGDLLFKIKSRHQSLDPSEKRVANFLLRNLVNIPYLSIGVIANEAKTSKTTVNRFCKKVDAKGYKDFKIQVLRYIASRQAGFLSGADIPQKRASSDPSSLLKAVIQSNVRKLMELQESNQPIQFQKAIDLFAHADKVLLLGVGSSAPVALDLQQRLSRLGIKCELTFDSHFQIVKCTYLSDKDVALAISHSGQTREIYECLKIAKRRKSKIISITSFPNSPIARIADCSLTSSALMESGMYLHESVSSRISQLAIGDVICAGLFLRKKEDIQDSLEYIEVELSRRRL